jgi:hypothetical protein
MEGLRGRMLRKSIIIGGIAPLLLRVRTMRHFMAREAKKP